MARLGPYELVERIGVGGMAEVFLATRPLKGVERRVVIKRILPALAELPEFVQMFEHEAQIAARLEHPNITQLLDFGAVGATQFLAFEYVEGASLDTVCRVARARGEQLPIAEVVKIVSLACEALHYAHRLTDGDGVPLGFVHRDVSPDNLLLGYSGAVKLTDFGIARVASLPRVTQTGILKGKPQYAAPEHIRGEVADHRADLFSLGVLLYQALSGVRPFEEKTPADTMRAIVLQPAPEIRKLRPEIPARLQAVLVRALEKQPAARYPDARAMQQELDAVLLAERVSVSGSEVAALVKRLVPPVARAGETEPQTSPSQPVAEPRTEPVRPAAPSARPKLRPSGWSAPAPEEEPEDTVTGATRPDPVELARRKAFELADATLPPDGEAGAGPARKRRQVPTAVLVAAMAALSLLAAVVWQLLPHPHRATLGARILDEPGNRLVVTANVVAADVFVNDRYLGKTPLEMENTFSFGERLTLSVRALGFPDVEAPLNGGRGERVEVTFAQPEEE